MIKSALFVLLLAISVNSNAGTAKWTLHFQQMESKKPNVSRWACEYVINNHKYTRIFENYCESTVEISWEN